MGKLFVVGTPIGNLGDMSQRGLETLESVSFIAAEDTRVTLKLLNRFEIKKPLISYHEHSDKARGEDIVNRILGGEDCALVSDAGMPVISDPGQKLIKACYDAGIEVVSVPGPTALATALAISGAECGRFCFEGFLSVNKPSRKEHLEAIKNETRLMVFYEAPHKLPATLRDMKAVLGEREIVLIKELTKIHEKVIHTTFSEALEQFEITPPKGEFVLLVKGAQEKKETFTLEEAVECAKRYQKEGMSTASAAKQAASEFGFSRKEIYNEIIK